MKNINRRIFFVMFPAVVLITGIDSCNNNKKDVIPASNGVFIAPTSQDQTEAHAFLAGAYDTGKIILKVALYKPATSDVAVSLIQDNAQVDPFNQRNKTTYAVIPDSLVSIDGNPSIVSGNRSSDSVSISIKVKDFVPGKRFLLPVSITSAIGGSVVLNPAEKTKYYLVYASLPQNIAIGKTIFASSTAYGGDPSRVNDGNTNGDWGGGSVFHSAQPDDDPYVEIDLGYYSSYIDHVVLYKRTDCCSERLQDFHLFVGANDFPRTVSDVKNVPGIFNYYEPGQPSSPVTIPVKQGGRYIRVQMEGSVTMNLAEMEIYGL